MEQSYNTRSKTRSFTGRKILLLDQREYSVGNRHDRNLHILFTFK